MRFVDITQEAGLDFVHISGGPEQRYILEAMGSGSAFFDFDADGWLDFFAISGTRLQDTPESGNRLWRNLPTVTGERVFTEVTEEAGLRRVGWGMGAAVADYDNDGDLDLYVTNWGPNALYRNEGVSRTNEQHGGFIDMSAASGIDQTAYLGLGVLFTDYDQDGDADLYIANDSTPNQLYRNDGYWRFGRGGL